MAVISRTRSEPASPKLSYKYQIVATVLANLSIISCGFHYAWPAPNLPKLFAEDSGVSISSDDGSWIAIAPLMSSVFGALAASTLVDKFGRRKSIILTIPLYATSWILIACASTFWSIMIGRLFGGFSDGITYTAVPMYVGEIAGKQVRGLLGSLVTVMLIFSQLLINAIAPFLSITHMSIIMFMVPVVQLLLCPWIIESPYYYLMKNDEDGARRSLQYLRNIENVETELKDLQYAVRRQMEEEGSFKDLVVVPGNRKALFICMGLRTFQQLTGISSILFYIQYIFSMVKAPISPVLTTIVFFSIQFVLSTCTSLLMDRLGRKLLYTISSAGSGITLAITGTYFYFLTETKVMASEYYLVPIIALCSFIFTYSAGMALIPLTVMSEIFPANVKGKALALMDMYFSLIVCIITKVFQILSDSYGIYVPFFMFSICCIGGVIFSTCYLPETKKKTLEEIQVILRTKKGIVNKSFEPAI